MNEGSKVSLTPLKLIQPRYECHHAGAEHDNRRILPQVFYFVQGDLKMEEKVLPPNEWILFNEIASMANQKGEARNSVRLLAKDLSFSTSTVWRLIGSLVKLGALAVTPDRLLIAADWLEAARAGAVQIAGINNWGIVVCPKTPGFLLGSEGVLSMFQAETEPFQAETGAPRHESCSEFLFRKIRIRNDLLLRIPIDFPKSEGISENKLSILSGSEEINSLAKSTGEITSGVSLPKPLESPDKFPSLASLASGIASDSGHATKGGGDLGTKRTFLPGVEAEAYWTKFWQEYPNKDGKADAISAWNRVIKAGVDPLKVIEGASAYATHVRQSSTPRMYIKRAKSFLLQASYEVDWSEWTAAKKPEKPKAYLITTLVSGDYKFDLWSNMHPEASKITITGPGSFALDGQRIFYSKTLQIFMSYQEFYSTNIDGTPWKGSGWWKKPEGKRLMKLPRF